MIRHYLTLLIILQVALLSGQGYLNETSRWKQYYRYSVYPPGIRFIEDFVIQLDGDTIINGLQYYKVLKTGVDSIMYPQGEGTPSNGIIHQYLNPIREADQAFYAYDLEEQSEYMLYDFGADIGDTLRSGLCQRDTVISIDTVYLGSVPRKRFHLPYSNSDFSQLIEGIGSTFGIPWEVCNVIPPAFVQLQCFSQDGAYIQFDPTYDCSTLVAVKSPEVPSSFSVHPNPFDTEIEIHTHEPQHQTVNVTLTSMFGALVYATSIPSIQSIERIALPNLPAGMYVLTIQTGKRITAHKVIKQ